MKISLSVQDIHGHQADVLLPPDDEFADRYSLSVAAGRWIAARSSVAIVCICRNAMPWLPQTLRLLEKTARHFGKWSAYIHENDSSDETKSVLSAWADGERRHVSLNDYGRPHLNESKGSERTVALAEYRNACQWFVRNGEPVDYVIVLDSDAWGGWSVDGLMTSLYWFDRIPDANGMASFSWCELPQDTGVESFQYDAWAARMNHWSERDGRWFHLWKPPIGSDPVRFNSAFGQLCIYRSEAFLKGQYAGGDCEHVAFHKSMGGNIYLNPSSRCVSFWQPRPNDGGQHGVD